MTDCRGSKPRCPWKIEFLPLGSVNGYAEVGIDTRYPPFCKANTAKLPLPRAKCGPDSLYPHEVLIER
jgi:hypothetical protein